MLWGIFGYVWFVAWCFALTAQTAWENGGNLWAHLEITIRFSNFLLFFMQMPFKLWYGDFHFLPAYLLTCWIIDFKFFTSFRIKSWLFRERDFEAEQKKSVYVSYFMIIASMREEIKFQVFFSHFNYRSKTPFFSSFTSEKM